MASKYVPVEDGSYQWSEQEAAKVNGAKLEIAVRPLETFFDSFGNPYQRLLGYESVEVELPDDIRLCRAIPDDAAGVPVLSDASIQRIQIILAKYEYKDLKEQEIILGIWGELDALKQGKQADTT